MCGRKTLLTEDRKQRLRELLSEQPDVTLAELGGRPDRPFRTSTVDLWLQRLGWKFKEALGAVEHDRTDVAARRAVWHERLACDPVAALVFVNEGGANTRTICLRGRAPGAQRLLVRVPRGSYQVATLIAGIRLKCPCVPWLYGGPMDSKTFPARTRQGLAPTLHAGDVVILDNLSTHKIRRSREAIEAAGARLLYVPPYSPDFNPIEPMWSKIKQMLRGHAPRTEDDLLQAVKTAFDSTSIPDCRASFFALDTLHN